MINMLFLSSSSPASSSQTCVCERELHFETGKYCFTRERQDSRIHTLLRFLEAHQESTTNMDRGLDRTVSTPTLRSGLLPPVDFFPSGSPLHSTYNKLLRRAAAKSRGSRRGDDSVDDGSISLQSSRRQRRSPKPGAPPAGFGVPEFPSTAGSTRASSRASEQTTAIENLHFTQQLLRRAANDASEAQRGGGKSRSPAARSRQAGSLIGSEARLEVALDQGANANDLKKNQELVDVLNDVQQVTICFQEIIRHLSFHRVETGRVLWKLQRTYIQLFERLVSAMYRGQQKKESTLLKEGSMRDEEMDLLRLRVLDLKQRLDAAERSKDSQKALMDTEAMRMTSMEAEIDELRAALVSEVKSAEDEAQRRVQEDADIRKKLEVSIIRCPALSPLSLSSIAQECLGRISNHNYERCVQSFSFACVSFPSPPPDL
jgi:hypothetical protein